MYTTCDELFHSWLGLAIKVYTNSMASTKKVGEKSITNTLRRETES